MRTKCRGIVETARSAFVLRVEPFQANHYQLHATFRDAFFNRFTEVAARIIGGYIHGYGVFAEVLDHIVKRRRACPCETHRR
jgi:hypothetical protein